MISSDGTPAHIEIHLDLYKHPPSSVERLARRYVFSHDDATDFLREAIMRILDGIEPGERRDIGIGLVVVASEQGA
jgi:hypothetical protein